jgi:hypothetical protein
MSDLLNDIKIFFSFLSFDSMRAAIKQPLTAIGLFFLWLAGTMRDLANLGKKDCGK